MPDTACFAAAPTVEGRTIRGLALPWATAASDRPVQFARGSLTWDEPVLRGMHDGATELPLAKLGAGLVLEDTAEGLVMEATLPETSRASDVLELIRAGVIDSLSAEVAIAARDTSTDPPTVTRGALVALALVPAGAFDEATLYERGGAVAPPSPSGSRGGAVTEPPRLPAAPPCGRWELARDAAQRHRPAGTGLLAPARA